MGEIATYENAGETYVSIARICKDLELDKANQLKKLKAGNYRCGLITTPDRRNVLQPHFCLNAKDLFRWLDGIAAGRIAAETALKLAGYKAALMDVLVDHEVQTRVQQQTPSVISPETQALLEVVRQTL